MKYEVKEIPLWKGKMAGDKLYAAQKYNNTGRYGISVLEVTKIEQKQTPKGKISGIYFYGKPVNYTLGDGTKDEYQFDFTEWTKDPVKAVSWALDKYLSEMYDKAVKPEDRLLAACFDERITHVSMEKLAGMIDVLKQFHELFAKAFAWKNEQVQNIAAEEVK